MVMFGIAAIALPTIGCSGSDSESTTSSESPVVQLGAPGESSRVLTDEEIDAVPVPTYSQTDVDFVHGMLAHHEQALIMTAFVAERSTNDQLALFVERLDISQTDEIVLMEKWLDERGENLPAGNSGHMAHMGLMPGMLSDDEISQLEQASGADFDRMFLEFMTRHHEGALVMVDDLFNSDEGGLETSIFQLASHIVSDQDIEISRMATMTDELDD